MNRRRNGLKFFKNKLTWLPFWTYLETFLKAKSKAFDEKHECNFIFLPPTQKYKKIRLIRKKTLIFCIYISSNCEILLIILYENNILSDETQKVHSVVLVLSSYGNISNLLLVRIQ